MLKKLFLNLFVLATLPSLFGCVTISNTNSVSVSGKLSAGGIYAQTNSPVTGDLTFTEMMDFMEPQPERTCVPVGHWVSADGKLDTALHDGGGFVQDLTVCSHDQAHGPMVKLVARAGAIMQSTDDYSKNKTALEEACRELGKACTYEKVPVTVASPSPDPQTP